MDTGESYYLAADLGAGSGRVVLGAFGERALHLEEVHRFPNPVQNVAGRQRWNTTRLFESIKTGIREAAAAVGPSALKSVGVDTWGVDYGLLDGEGRLLEEPVCYRDERTESMMEKAFARIDRAEIYRLTGIQFMPFNTLFQLFAQRQRDEWPADADRLLMMPDLMHHRLAGVTTGEFTDATTTQLVNARTGTWEPRLFEALDLDRSVMPELVPPGTRLGPLRPELARELDLDGLEVVAPATHDTASAVAGTPLGPGWLYLSSGTWSLLGMETEAPVINEAAAAHDFTNEGGAAGRNRLLKNVMGLWILESARREWAGKVDGLAYEALFAAIARQPPFQALIYPDDLRFLNPANMSDTIASYLRETGQPEVTEPAALARVILESLALRYASVVDRLGEITSVAAAGVHIVGGGSRNDFLNQATANATGLPVLAGPVEATALGNLAVQAIADGRFRDLEDARAYIRGHQAVREYAPRDTEEWNDARERYRALESAAQEEMPGA